MIRDVTDLQVYVVSMQLLPQIYMLTRKLPRSEYDLILQLKKASKSIPANIAEGFAKRSSDKECKRFLKIALGSSDEIITHLRVVTIVAPIVLDEAKSLGLKYKELSKRINVLSSRWQSGGPFQQNQISSIK